ncbi:MAG: DUF378 domain-containing protein [Clostridia bacterium]|nr:DUF378 domain-containing protein [Clostridia bacterium]
MIIANIIALSIMIFGCFNWFLVGVFSWNLVTWIFGVGVVTRILYAIVGLAGIWMLIQLIMRRTRLFSRDQNVKSKNV